jgi:hypothetical protein
MRSKAEGWLGQRKAIVTNLMELPDEATKLLNQLGHDVVAEVPFHRGRRGCPGASKNLLKNVQPKKRRKMSAASRVKIAAAQKKRWAKQKAGDKE